MPSENPSRLRLIVSACAVLVCVAVVLWVQAALAGLPEHGFRAAPNSQLTQAYTSALAAGQSHLQQSPDPRLLALPNPYDPAKNGGLGLLDVSLYQQRYYLYFGIVPWVLVLVPWFKITGTHLSDAGAIWIFCSVGFACYGLALFQIWRRWFRSVSSLILAAAVALLAVCTSTWVLLDLPQMTQIPSAAAYGCLGFAWLGIICAEVHPTSRRLWLGLALFGAALTMGCRPNYAPVVTLMAGWAAFQIWSHQPASQRLRSLLWVFLPLIIVGALLAGFNYLRFGNPLEFGFSYQLVAVNRAAGEGEMSARYLAFNLHRYLFGGARWTDYFPFIAGEAPGPFPLPAGHDASDQIYGLLWVTPVVLLGAAAFFRQTLPPIRTLALLTLFVGVANLLLLGAFGGSAYRYPADFLPSLSLTATIGLFGLASISSAWLRRLSLTLASGLLAWSAAASLWVVASLYDQLAAQHPQAFARLAQPFNALIYFREHQTSDGPRSLRLHLRFPPDRIGQVEPLVVLGPQSQQDFLYVYYSAPGQLRFGFESIGRGGPTSRPVSVDLSQPHILDLHYGSFLPPDDHPLLHTTPAADRDLARRMLTVTLDGRPVLDGWADFHPRRGVEHIGTSPDDNAFGPRFTGTITRAERPLITAPSSPVRIDPAHYGSIQLNVILRPAPAGTREPLLSLGHRNQGELFVVERVSSTHVRVGEFPTAGPETWSGPFPWPLDRPQTLTLATGALLPPATASLWPTEIGADARALAKRTVELHLEDQLVWRAEVPPLDVSPSTVVPGRNDLLLTGIAPTLAADIIATTRLPWVGLTKPAAPPARAAGSDPKISDRTSIPR